MELDQCQSTISPHKTGTGFKIWVTEGISNLRELFDGTTLSFNHLVKKYGVVELKTKSAFVDRGVRLI